MCDKYIELLSPYLDGELTYKERLELEEHLESCPACREALKFFKDISDSVMEEVKAPAELSQNVMDAVYKTAAHTNNITDTTNEHKLKKRRNRLWLHCASLAAGIAIIILSVYTLSPFGSNKNTTNTSGIDNSAADFLPEAAADGALNGGDSAGNGGDTFDMAAPESGDVVQNAPLPAPDPTSNAITDNTMPDTDANTVDGGTSADNITPTETPESAKRENYYTIITITGVLPEILDEFEKHTSESGETRIYVPAHIADELIAMGSEHTPVTPENGDIALIIVYGDQS